MITFVYDILFLLPFAVPLSLFLKPYFWPEYGSLKVILISIACCVIILLLRHLKTQGRIWLMGTCYHLLDHRGVLQVSRHPYGQL